jgi:hypothetical protein
LIKDQAATAGAIYPHELLATVHPPLPFARSGVTSHSSRQPYEKPLEILQKALEHPEGLLMNLDSADDEVLSFQVVCGTGSLAQRMRIA